LLLVVRALRAGGGRAGEWGAARARLSAAVTLDARPEFARATLRFCRADALPTATILGDQVSNLIKYIPLVTADVA
jgi:hypothetical protein